MSGQEIMAKRSCIRTVSCLPSFQKGSSFFLLDRQENSFAFNELTSLVFPGGGFKIYAFGAPSMIPCSEMADYLQILVDECSCSGDPSLGDRTDGRILYSDTDSYIAFHRR